MSIWVGVTGACALVMVWILWPMVTYWWEDRQWRKDQEWARRRLRTAPRPPLVVFEERHSGNHFHVSIPRSDLEEKAKLFMDLQPTAAAIESLRYFDPSDWEAS